MTVQNSKQIRRQIANQERKVLAPKHTGKRTQIVPTQEDFERVIEIHNAHVQTAIEQGDGYWAGWHARQAVSYLKTFRALGIARDFRRAIWKAYDCARHELYNCEF